LEKAVNGQDGLAMNTCYTMGIDIGSTASKCIILKEIGDGKAVKES
jgi:activator of 2-hydroxyglutaryl-CoA dehydratase